MNLRDEIKGKFEDILLGHFCDRISTEALDEYSNEILKLFEKRIDEKKTDILIDIIHGEHDYEGKSNLESQIDMLDDWKHKVIKQ